MEWDEEEEEDEADEAGLNEEDEEGVGIEYNSFSLILSPSFPLTCPSLVTTLTSTIGSYLYRAIFPS